MEKFEQASGQEEQGLWKKIQKYAEVGALAALLSLGSAESGAAQEHSVEKNKDSVKDLVEAVKQKGQEGNMLGHPVRKLVTPEGAMVGVGYTPDGGVAFFVQENANSTMRFFDLGGDGSVDRVVMNNQAEAPSQKRNTNDLKTFGTMESLVEAAQTQVTLDEQENAQVYEVLKVAGQDVVRIVDFQTGNAQEANGDEAKKIASMLQGGYSIALNKTGK